MSPLAVLGRSVRYLAPIAVVCALVMAPVAMFALGVKSPGNAKQAGVVLRVAWLCATSGMLALLVLVAGLAPILRAASLGRPLSQLAALGIGVRGLVRAIVPVVLVLCAVAMGLVALAVPGVLLYVLFVFAPASDASGLDAKLADSIAIVRVQWRSIASVIIATMFALAVVVAVQQLMLPIPLGKTPPKAQLALFPQLVRILATTMMGIVPIAALALASIDASVRANRAEPNADP
ncbi:MAG: hypothetical protein ACKV2T_36435 [Kofleriaceae bacterium]